MLIGSITDLRKREVPDYVSYGLIFAAFASATLYAIVAWDYRPLVQTIMGFLIGMGIAYAMFYLGQWGGGDSKLIMGLGAIIGFNAFALFGDYNYWLLILLINIIIVGAVYGLFWSAYLALSHRAQFKKALLAISRKRNILIMRRIALGALVILLALTILVVPEEYKLFLFIIIAAAFFIFYLWIFVKVIEQGCMVKTIPIAKLTEGDWIYTDVYVGKKYVAGPKDLGISQEQIALLKKYEKQGKIKKITIKEGIPFIPAFLIAFIITMMLYSLNIFRLF